MSGDGPTARKFSTEIHLSVTVAALFIFRPQEMHDVSLADYDDLDRCHLYVISRSPRVTIDPADVSVNSGVATGTVQVQFGGDVQRHPFQIGLAPAERDLVWKSNWPHDTFSLETSEGETVFSGVCALLAVCADQWPEAALRQEILYVGQAFGVTGERTAWDRLKGHETLQRILASQNPDQQVWLTLAAVVDTQVISEIVAGPTRMSDEEDNEHLGAVMRAIQSGNFRERESVALAEAGLIRGWQPEFNDRMKYNFPARKQVPLETARALDLHGLIVEWQSDQLRPWTYWSGSQAPSWLFFYTYEIHTEPGREITLILSSLSGGSA